ncbi:MAG TPA: helicase-related protein [Verrucomicrobiae bacterium]
MDLALELPCAPLEAVMSNEVWEEVYRRLAELIQAHRTTLVFVNTRRLAERLTHHLSDLLGKDAVASHHGSLSAKLRLEAEDRLKRGDLKALVATASLELGIDIGSVDLVCQIGSTRSIATLLQRVGRARHQREGLPKGRIFPLSRDELLECVALLRSVRRGELDSLQIPEKPLDVLAQQIVACAIPEDWDETALFELLRGAWPYRNLTREKFEEVLKMLAEGFSTKRGRRGALIHYDAVNHRLRARRGARLVALTSGGAIPDSADYRVVVEPDETFIGTVNEDFAFESAAGDIFQLGNASWRVLRLNAGTMRVAAAPGQLPNIPFWLGEAPGRTTELSRAVSDLRTEIERVIEREQSLKAGPGASPDGASPELDRAKDAVARSLVSAADLTEPAARQLADYFVAAYQALRAIPSQNKLILERFFDESGGMQLVLHSPFGIRINRAWGLALRKRFCRSFNFELQAAATDEAIILSLGTQHSFPLDEVFQYLSSRTVRDLLVQALLDAPMFPIRWRWNAGRALALPRQRGSRRLPPQVQRMESENLLAAVFPDQLACLENIAGDREVPDHPLVNQTIHDCLTEAMDIDGLIELLKRIETGSIRCLALDLPEPSPLAHEIVHAKPYAFLDNAPIDERRTQAVYARRFSDASDPLGILDQAAIAKVCAEAWPRATDPDELHDALLLGNSMTEPELVRVAAEAQAWLAELATQNRACRLKIGAAQAPFWVAAERLSLLQAIFPGAELDPPIAAADSLPRKHWDRPEALRELVRGRVEISGPISARELSDVFHVPESEIHAALLALEAEGFVLRGKFRPGAADLEWCERRLLARIHRLTINRLRAEIEPVSIADFLRFLSKWQRVDPEDRAAGPEGLQAVLELLDGYEVPAGAWEPEVLAARVRDYTPQWLDQACFRGQIGWGRLSLPPGSAGGPFAPIRSSPIALFTRHNLPCWLLLVRAPSAPAFSPDTTRVLEALLERGALFFGELAQSRGLLPSRIEQALAELVAQGWATADSFEGLRALLTPPDKRVPFADPGRKRRHKPVTSLEFAGRWSLLRSTIVGHEVTSAHPEVTVGHEVTSADSEVPSAPAPTPFIPREQAVETLAHTLLGRYGVVFRRLLERESLKVSWFELGRVYRRLEARGEIRGGYFVGGVSGEQFALPEAIGLLRSTRKEPPAGRLLAISGADPLNLTGILTTGPRISAITSNRILLRDGVPVAALEAGQILMLDPQTRQLDPLAERTLRVGTMAAALRPYYA